MHRERERERNFLGMVEKECAVSRMVLSNSNHHDSKVQGCLKPGKQVEGGGEVL